MGLFEKLRGELVDIVEWIDDTRTTLVWRFPRYHNQIKQGARLIVRPGQMAIFVHQGKLADTFEPGTYELNTGNLPILSTLQAWQHGFDSPFKSEVYFVTTRQITGLKWGTPNPIMLRDQDFGPLRLRAFGTYNLQAIEPKALLQELVGTDGNYDADEVVTLMRSIIVEAFTDLLGTEQIAALDLAANYRDLSGKLRDFVAERIDDEYGLAIPELFLLNVSLPEEVQKALDARSSMGVIGDLGQYQAYQMGQAMAKAAENPGGGAAEGMGMGMGFAMANQMAQGMGRAQGAGAAATPPPAPAVLWHVSANGQTSGPFTQAQLADAAAQGSFSAVSYVWRQGMAAWTPAGEVAEFRSLFAAPPPPPPAG